MIFAQVTPEVSFWISAIRELGAIGIMGAFFLWAGPTTSVQIVDRIAKVIEIISDKVIATLKDLMANQDAHFAERNRAIVNLVEENRDRLQRIEDHLDTLSVVAEGNRNTFLRIEEKLNSVCKVKP
jgi:hypothetical protein